MDDYIADFPSGTGFKVQSNARPIDSKQGNLRPQQPEVDFGDSQLSPSPFEHTASDER